MIRQLFEKHQDKILYLVFGALTTAVNTGIYWLCAHPLSLPVVPATVIAWFFAVLFAYLTNRKWVFHSEASTRKEIFRESVSFFLCRLGTGVLDWVLMYLLVDCLHWPDLWVKIGVNVMVILLNYIASKLLIFKHKP
jgi:putative flippase GtrA